MDKNQVLKLRKRVGWTQKQMAVSLGIADGHTISHWENGVRVPKGMSERILKLLSALPNNELRKITKRLEKLSTEASSARK